eukprot:symbB.v1.2.032289.t1/scaffold3854.1/size49228/1
MIRDGPPLFQLHHSFEELRQSHSFVCEAVSRNGDALRYVDPEFHWDVKVVRNAVRQRGMALRFAVPELRADLSLVTEATKNTPKAFAFACGPLKWDRTLVLDILQVDGSLLQHLPQELRCDRDVVTTAVKQYGRAIMWASGSLKQDVSVVLEAVKQDGSALQLIAEVLKSFRNVALEAPILIFFCFFAAEAAEISRCPMSKHLAVCLCGQRYEASEDVYPGFFQRLEGSLLSVMSTGPCRVMVTVTADGCLELQEEHLPEEVRRLFPDIWSYLQTGCWEAKTTPRAICDLQKALSFLNLKAQIPDDESPVLFVHKHMITVHREDALAMSWMEGPLSGKVYNLHGGSDFFVHQTGTLTLKHEHGSLKLDPQTGALYLKLPESTTFVWITTNRQLRGKLMHSMVLRQCLWEKEVVHPPRRLEGHRNEGPGFLLLVQFRTKIRDPHRDPKVTPAMNSFVSWPNFWFMVDIEVVDGSRRGLFRCRKQDLRPGGVSTLEDGSVLWLTNPESLRKARLTIFRAHDMDRDLVSLPGVVINLVAPKPYHAGYEGLAAHLSTKGRGKGTWFDPAPGLRTLHPQGRAPASVWVVQREGQLILLIHAADRRVALAQFTGKGGCLPRVWKTSAYYIILVESLMCQTSADRTYK